MTTAAIGDTVQVHYTLTSDAGEVLDSSRGRDPLEVTIGGGSVIPGFEQALVGMAEGQTKQVTLEAADAYGRWQEELVHEVPRSQLPDGLELEVGRQLSGTDQEGRTLVLTVRELADETVKLDANHPLAGQELTFDLEVVGVV
jgi:peptidylprolyl isomerase